MRRGREGDITTDSSSERPRPLQPALALALALALAGSVVRFWHLSRFLPDCLCSGLDTGPGRRNATHNVALRRPICTTNATTTFTITTLHTTTTTTACLGVALPNPRASPSSCPHPLGCEYPLSLPGSDVQTKPPPHHSPPRPPVPAHCCPASSHLSRSLLMPCRDCPARYNGSSSDINLHHYFPLAL